VVRLLAAARDADPGRPPALAVADEDVGGVVRVAANEVGGLGIEKDVAAVRVDRVQRAGHLCLAAAAGDAHARRRRRGGRAGRGRNNDPAETKRADKREELLHGGLPRVPQDSTVAPEGPPVESYGRVMTPLG